MKTSYFVFIVLLFSTTVFSQTVDIGKARSISENWASSHNLQPTVENIIYKSVKNDTLLYIFNFKNAWIMISADVSLFPILGFSLNSNYSESNEPDAVKSLFEIYDIVKKDNLLNKIEFSTEWELIESENLKNAKSESEVNPLIPVTWNQDWPYNAYCPEDSEMPANFNGLHNTSCGPTAFAQILRYWRYPVHGTGYNSYTYSDLG